MSHLMNLPRIVISLAMLTVFAFAFTMTAKADPVLLVNGGPSVTFTYQSATFVNSNATATFTLSGDILTVQLTNTSTELGDGTILTGLGFDTTPNVTGTIRLRATPISGLSTRVVFSHLKSQLTGRE